MGGGVNINNIFMHGWVRINLNLWVLGWFLPINKSVWVVIGFNMKNMGVVALNNQKYERDSYNQDIKWFLSQFLTFLLSYDRVNINGGGG